MHERAWFGLGSPCRRSSRSLSLLVALACAACGGSSGKSGAETPGSGTAGGTEAPPPSGPLTEEECMQLLEHYLELALAEKRATLPPEQVPTGEQVEGIRTAMREEAKQSCVGRAERGRYDCAMKARTTRALGVCMAERAEGG